MQWTNFYIERMGKYHLYSRNELNTEHAVFDMFGKLKTITNDSEGIFDGWPVSVISIVSSNPLRTEVSVDGDCFTIKAGYLPCKDVLIKEVELHNRTVPLHYIHNDRQGGEHPRMIFVVDKNKYTKQDIMNMFRKASK